MRFWFLLVLAAVALGQSPRAVYEQAVADFRAGRIEKSVEGFDRLAKMSPGDAPHLWQRGIALYYAKRFGDCKAQFESHRTVNPNDVENAAWHFLCVARMMPIEKARAALLPVGPDARVPMREVYRMFKGELTAEEVKAAAKGNAEASFYADLYVGLYCEALGKAGCAREHIEAAARAEEGGYMHMVAEVHARLLAK